MPRPTCAFCAPRSLLAPFSPASSLACRPPSRRPAHSASRRTRPPCASALIAVELAAAGADGRGALTAALRRAPRRPYLLYVADASHEAVLAAVGEAGLPEGDAVSAAGGLYQRGYVTPDPLWARRCWVAWDPKPTRWVVGQFFEGQVAERTGGGVAGEEMEVVYEVVGNGDLIGLRDEIQGKLEEMGVAGVVGLRGGSGKGGSIVVRPAGAPTGAVVEFCVEMLKVEGKGGVCAFGGRGFVEACLEVGGEGSVGIVCCGEEDGVDGEGQSGRVFWGKGTGVDALVEGLEHFGLLQG